MLQKAKELYNEYENELAGLNGEFDALYESGLVSLPNWLNRVYDIGIDLLRGYGISDTDKAALTVILSEDYQSTIDRTLDRYMEAFRYLARYVQDTYSCRIEVPSIRWVGGGFTVTGAIKGTITAGAMNFASAMLTSIGQAVLDAKMISNINRKKAEIVTDWKLEAELPSAVYRFAQGLTPTIERLLVSHHMLSQGGITEYEIQDIYKEAGQFEKEYYNLKDNGKRDRAIEIWLKLAQRCPTHASLYARISELFVGDPQYFEVKKDLDELTTFFGIKNEYEQLRISLVY